MRPTAAQQRAPLAPAPQALRVLWTLRALRASWAPPAWLFGPVWTFLYVLIAVSFGKVFWMAWGSEIPIIIALPFILNLIFNFAFTPLEFGLKNNLLAVMDVLLVFGTLIWAIVAVYSYASWIAYIQIPYLLWVSFATVLQLTITFLNKSGSKPSRTLPNIHRE